MSTSGSVIISGAVALRIEFHASSWLESCCDRLKILTGTGSLVTTKTGSGWATGCLEVPGQEVRWQFTTDSSVTGWGWYFSVYPVMASTGGTQVFKNKKIFSKYYFSGKKISVKYF
jgi:hypothetical protein